MMRRILMILGHAFGLSSLLVACASSYRADSLLPRTTKEPAILMTTDPNQSAVPNNSKIVQKDVVPTNPKAASNALKTMIIEGSVEKVMESYPLQLMVKTEAGQFFVSLQSGTNITQKGKTMEQGILTPGMRVQITGQQPPNNDMAIIAETIKIQQ
jgi:hypothetical protein